ARQQQEQQLQTTFDEMVEKGQMTRDQANQQMESARERMAMGRGPIGWILQTVGIFIVGFIVFFLVVLIYFLFAKFAFKGNGGYTFALVGSGLTAYISIIHVVLAAILVLAFGRLMSDLSIASFANMDKTTITGWVLGKIDPFSIWAYTVTGIGLVKMFKSDSSAKYFILVFGVWILGSLLLWGIGQAVPLLSFLSAM
ncbi:MAG: YIP1 family protein, partial [Ignavibacteria bacterium]|nr:YIP1 family protein [Ignavibacteria bacterium]